MRDKKLLIKLKEEIFLLFYLCFPFNLNLMRRMNLIFEKMINEVNLKNETI